MPHINSSRLTQYQAQTQTVSLFPENSLIFLIMGTGEWGDEGDEGVEGAGEAGEQGRRVFPSASCASCASCAQCPMPCLANALIFFSLPISRVL